MKTNKIHIRPLQAFSDQSNGAYYGYDASGERAYKLAGPTININQNGIDYNMPILQTSTIYASPLVTVSARGYTKHYFEEGKRICSKIGGGALIGINVPVVDNTYLEELSNNQKDGILNTFNECMGFEPEVSTIEDLSRIVEQYEYLVDPVEAGYYYHSDHLGSSSYITDDWGVKTQTLAYMPYGEDWVNLTYNNPLYETTYKYNGKEKDDETGYNYYGARYYSSDLPIWLSVDPMSDNYPSLTGYVYCANNPIMLIDPDGREIKIYYKNKTGFARLFERSKSVTYTPGMSYSGNNKFVSETVKALDYAQKGDNLGIINKLAKDKRLVKIKQTSIGNDNYNEISNTVRYNPQSGLEGVDQDGNPTGQMQSPALGLLHELGHAFIDFFKSNTEKKELYQQDNVYDTKEEKFVIENIETPAAKTLEEGVRENHDGEVFTAKHSTSKEEIK